MISTSQALSDYIDKKADELKDIADQGLFLVECLVVSPGSKCLLNESFGLGLGPGNLVFRLKS